MTVRELIDLLQKMPKKKHIVIETPLGLTFNIQHIVATDDEVIIVSTIDNENP